ncbi:MAG TPA: YnbE family lipoprotein [Methylococcaceae bacterium]|nr:YnbE family lipoprotein [Methylococcaceae bacterium]
MKHPSAKTGALLGALAWVYGCSPTVKVEAPDKPIEINMNVKIEHEIRLKVEKDVDELISKNKGLF